MAGAWFLAREAELSTTRASLLTFGIDSVHGGPVVTWSLPASKNDAEARGVARSHGFCCGERSWACPFHVLKNHVGLLMDKFKIENGSLPRDLPLFPDSKGEVVSKELMTATIV